VKRERTAYETDPVENIGEAIVALTHAYNRLQDALHAEPEKYAAFGEALRAEINKPVPIHGKKGLQMSMYEIGIAHAPDKEGSYSGRLGVNGEKLNRALEDRTVELQALLTCEKNGLLPRLCRMLDDFKQKSAPNGGALAGEAVYPPLLRFGNECRRLQAFWWQ
jgi:hypothetical protein